MGTLAIGNGRSVVGQRIADRYELLELVGTGGMSSVYKASDTLLERSVALKILHAQYTGDEDYVERFRREARAVAQLSHPNIVTVIDRGEEGERQFIVFEYVDGENLKDLINRNGPLPVRRAVELTLQVAHGLAFAHAQGLVHRDVKPQNVLLNGEGEAKVTDFGIARSLDVERGMTQTGTVLGSSNYIAPEQASGRQVNEQTDVYSLGVVLYELLTGEVPFPGDNFVAVAMKHVNEPPPSVLERRPDVPPRLGAAIDRALEKAPADRFPSMPAFASELQACLDELALPDDERTAIVRKPVAEKGRPRRVRAGRRSRWPLALSALALLAAAAVVVGVLAFDGSGGKTGSPPAPIVVQLKGVASYDPNGTGGTGEHDNEVGFATDGDPGTAWHTEDYRNFTKPGVGLVLDAGRAVALPRLTIASDLGGYQAQIKVSNSPSSDFVADSAWQDVAGTTAFKLNGRSGRYYLVWVKLPFTGGQADVTEARAG